MPNYLAYLVVGVVAGLAMIAGHWLPWRFILGQKLPRLAAYSYGVAAMLGPVLVALWLEGYFRPFWLIVTAAASSGIATIIGYMIDDAAQRRHHTADLEDKVRYAERDL